MTSPSTPAAPAASLHAGHLFANPAASDAAPFDQQALQAPPAAEPAPVPALAYSSDPPDSVASTVLTLVVGAAALAAALTLVHSLSGLWVQFSRTPFRGVGGFQRGTWEAVVGPLVLGCTVLGDAVLLAGTALFFRRGRAARAALMWGAAFVVAGGIGTFLMQMVSQSVLRNAGFELRSAVVLTLWRVQWTFMPVALPTLLLVVMARGEVRRWMRYQSGPRDSSR